MSNYKLEVENTEKLKNDINSAFTDINTEFKKDGDLIANGLFDVDRCIEELKKSRKRWARGTFKITSSEILDIGTRGATVMFYAEVPVQFEMDSIFIYSHLNIIKGATSSGGEYNNSVAYNEIKDTKNKFPVLYGEMFGNSKYFTNDRINYTEIDGTSKVPVLKYYFDYYRDHWADKNLVEEINRILSPNFKIDVFGR